MEDENTIKHRQKQRELIDQTISNLSDTAKFEFQARRIRAVNALNDQREIPAESIPLHKFIHEADARADKMYMWTLVLMIVLVITSFLIQQANLLIIAVLVISFFLIRLLVLKFDQLNAKIRFNTLQDKLADTKRTLENIQVFSAGDFFGAHRDFLNNLPRVNPFAKNEHISLKIIEQYEKDASPSSNFEIKLDEEILRGMGVIDVSFFWRQAQDSN